MKQETPQPSHEPRVDTETLYPRLPDGTRRDLSEQQARERYFKYHAEVMQTWVEVESQYLRRR